MNDISVSTFVTRILRELAVDIESLHSDVTSKDIRVGSANDIVNAEGIVTVETSHIKYCKFAKSEFVS